MSSVLALDNITKSFPSPSGGRIEILSGVSLSLEKGEIVSIIGQSGSGKSTLLSIAALLMSPDSGSVRYSEKESTGMSERKLQAIRASSIGFIFQSSSLLSDFSALENTAMPLMIQGKKRKAAMAEAESFLALVGLQDRAGHRPSELSGGERQRAAIARALAGNPLVVFADEPTGSLDEKSAALTEEILFSSVRNTNHSMLLVTHNREFARKADRMLELREGILQDV